MVADNQQLVRGSRHKSVSNPLHSDKETAEGTKAQNSDTDTDTDTDADTDKDEMCTRVDFTKWRKNMSWVALWLLKVLALSWK